MIEPISVPHMADMVAGSGGEQGWKCIPRRFPPADAMDLMEGGHAKPTVRTRSE